MDEANEVIAPRLGLSSLPVVDFPDDTEQDDEPDLGVHWKTASLVRWAAGRPFVWLDDEITDADRRWIAMHHAGRALAHRVDPLAGLTAAYLTHVRAWLWDGSHN